MLPFGDLSELATRVASRRNSKAPLRNKLTQTLGSGIMCFPDPPGGTAPTTFLMFIPLETHCYAIRLGFLNCYNYSMAITSAAVYASDTYSTAASADIAIGNNMALPTLNGTINTRGSKIYFDNQGIDRPNVKKAGITRCFVLPANATNTAHVPVATPIQWSDYVPFRIVPRVDGGVQPLIAVAVTVRGGFSFACQGHRSFNGNAAHNRNRRHYGFWAVRSGTDWTDNLAGANGWQYPGPTYWTPLFAVQYLTTSPGIQVVSSGDSLAASPQSDGFSTAGWRACADLSTPAMPYAYASLAWGGVGYGVYEPHLMMNAPAIEPSILLKQVISRNGVAGAKDMEMLLGLALSDADQLARSYGTRTIFWTPGGEPSWDGNPDYIDGFVCMRDRLAALAKTGTAPLVDGPSALAPPSAPWNYLPGMSDDDTHPNDAASEAVVPLVKAAYAQVVSRATFYQAPE